MPEVEKADVRLYYELSGKESGEALVLGNSLGSNLHMWDKVLPWFESRYHVIRFDTRGHGRSSVPSGPYTLEDLGRDALTLMNSLGLETANFWRVAHPSFFNRRQLNTAGAPSFAFFAKGDSSRRKKRASIPVHHPTDRSPGRSCRVYIRKQKWLDPLKSTPPDGVGRVGHEFDYGTYSAQPCRHCAFSGGRGTLIAGGPLIN